MGDMPQLEYVLRGMKRMTTAPGRTRMPVTMEVLRGLKQVWQKLSDKREVSMLWAAATLCFFWIPLDRGSSSTSRRCL